jgi:hypothetical protein
LALDVVGADGGEGAVAGGVPGRAGAPQVILEIRLLVGEREPQPLREYLLVELPEVAVGLFGSEQTFQIGMRIPAGRGVP